MLKLRMLAYGLLYGLVCGSSGLTLWVLRSRVRIRMGTFWSNDSTGDLQLAFGFGHRLTRMDRIVVAIDETF